MIIFNGSKRLGKQIFLTFQNETGSFVNIPVDEKTYLLIINHFNLLAPGTGKPEFFGVEQPLAEDKQGQ